MLYCQMQSNPQILTDIFSHSIESSKGDHGGVELAMDVVQVVMAVFSYLYYNNYIAKLASVSVGAVLNAVMQLDSKAQYELFSQLGNMLAAKRQIPGKRIGEACLKITLQVESYPWDSVLTTINRKDQ